MIGKDYIKQRFACIGAISDTGIVDFATDNSISHLIEEELAENDKMLIASTITTFINDNLLHPKSVNENGFSLTWSDAQIKGYQLLMLRKYGIELNSETAVSMGLNVVVDNSDCW